MRYFFLLFGFSLSIQAQDDLFSMLEPEPAKPKYVMATFKATRIVNSQSIELVRPQTLEFMIQHRFGSMKNGLYDIFGMDEASIRFDLHYGISERISFGVGRSSLGKTYDIFSKIKLVRQSSNFPISIATYFKTEIETKERLSEFSAEIENRLTYDSQLLFARKINRSISLQLMPTWIHHNWVSSIDKQHDLFSIGVGGRIKLTKRVSLNVDTFIPINKRAKSFVRSWGIGCDIETGGHVFQLMLTNVQGAFESIYIENASGEIQGMDLFLGFNITRAFAI